MIVLEPLLITAAHIISSNAAESLYPTWSAGTAYTTGQRVFYQGKDYEAARNNTGKTPGTSELDWVLIGASNRYAMFDQVLGNPTVAPLDLDVTIDPPGTFNALRLEDIRGRTVQVIVTEGMDTLYTRTDSLVDNSTVDSAYEYVFSPISYRTDYTLLDLPHAPMGQLRVVVDNDADQAQIGELVCGVQSEVGVTNFGTSVGIKSYSRRERDQFGNVIRTVRRPTKRVTYDVTVPTISIEAVRKRFERLESRLTLFVGDVNRPETVVLGYYEDFGIPIESPSISTCTIDVEGII